MEEEAHFGVPPPSAVRQENSLGSSPQTKENLGEFYNNVLFLFPTIDHDPLLSVSFEELVEENWKIISKNKKIATQ